MTMFFPGREYSRPGAGAGHGEPGAEAGSGLHDTALGENNRTSPVCAPPPLIGTANLSRIG